MNVHYIESMLYRYKSQSLPTVAAVIPCRNRRIKTERFLQFFTKQSYPNLRIVMVDANSTDGTRDMLALKFPDIDLVCTDDESYWTASTNRGIEFALSHKCDYILTINDDSYAVSNYVEKLVALAENNKLDILASRIDFFKAPGLVWSLGAYSTWGSRDLFGLNYHAIWEDKLPSTITHKDFFKVESAPGDGVLIHKSVFDKVGLYDENNTPHYHADSEFIMRARLAGITAYVAPKIVVYNDCPLPGDNISEQQRSFRNSFEKFAYVFFHKKSHLVLWPRIFVIQKYCPNNRKIETYIKGVLIFALEPIFRKINKKIFSYAGSKSYIKGLLKKIVNKVGFLWAKT